VVVGPISFKSVDVAMYFIWLILLPCICRCIPFRYRDIKDEQKKLVEVLMINSQSGPGLLFPKGGWENDETVEEAAAREAIEEAGVRGDLVVRFQNTHTHTHTQKKLTFIIAFVLNMK